MEEMEKMTEEREKETERLRDRERLLQPHGSSGVRLLLLTPHLIDWFCAIFWADSLRENILDHSAQDFPLWLLSNFTLRYPFFFYDDIFPGSSSGGIWPAWQLRGSRSLALGIHALGVVTSFLPLELTW